MVDFEPIPEPRGALTPPPRHPPTAVGVATPPPPRRFVRVPRPASGWLARLVEAMAGPLRRLLRSPRRGE